MERMIEGQRTDRGGLVKPLSPLSQALIMLVQLVEGVLGTEGGREYQHGTVSEQLPPTQQYGTGCVY